jgi:hypothetical protein
MGRGEGLVAAPVASCRASNSASGGGMTISSNSTRINVSSAARTMMHHLAMHIAQDV